MNQKQQRGTGYVAALVARLGGDVVITDEEARRAGDLQIDFDPQRLQTRISLKPVELVGEIVTAEPQSITALDQVAWAMTLRDIEIDQELDQ